MPNQTIDVETVPAGQSQPSSQTALAVRPTSEQQAVGRAMSVQELTSQLAFIKEVMRDVMVENHDYGKIPGTGEKPSLLQPGAQKLMMTFRLTDEVFKEEIINLNLPTYGHREVRYVVRLHGGEGKHWDGVGSCSTLESKYRYRKANRKCPACGKETIIEGKPEYGGGFICWKKKGGCDAKFAADAPAIISQPGGMVEHDNPADFWNTVQKMAFKRALVHAAINSTNTSDLWTQDLEDMSGNEEMTRERAKASQASQKAPPPQTATQAPKPAQTQQSAQKPPQNAPTPAKPAKCGTETTRAWMLNELRANPGEPACQLVTEYFQKAGQILPTEEISALPLHFLPVSRVELGQLKAKLALFEQGHPAERAFEPHYVDSMPGQSVTQARQQVTQAPAPAPAAAPAAASAPYPENPRQVAEQERKEAQQTAVDPIEAKAKELKKADPEWYMKIVVPIPRKGMKRDEYMRNPETIGQLYLSSKQGHDDDNRRLWGFVNHYEPKGWEKRDGTKMPPNDTDKLFRWALDDFADDHGKPEDSTGRAMDPADENNGLEPERDKALEEDDDIPF